jgi:hypothetical protein
VCRLAVFPSLPRATNLLERFTSEQLKDARFQKLRMLERIKQGIGRCTRGESDYAIYYFLDPRFHTEMECPAFSSIVSERTRRQVELGLALTENGMGAVVPFARKFLKGRFSEFDEREASMEPFSAAPSESGRSGTVKDEVEGWRAFFEHRNFERAVERFEAVAKGLENAEREHRAFWKYMEAFAELLRHRLDEAPGSLERTVDLLKQAIKEGGSASWFNRLAKATNRLQQGAVTAPAHNFTTLFDAWDPLVERYPYQKGRFLKWHASLKSELDGTHDQVCKALETIGALLGFSASRPAGSGKADGLWREPSYALTIEVKKEVTRDSISRGDVNQADGQRRTAILEMGLAEDRVDGIIVSSMAKINSEAAKALGRIRVVQLELVEEVRSRLEVIMRDYWKTWTREDAAARERARRIASARLPGAAWLSRAIKLAQQPMIPKVELFKEWK